MQGPKSRELARTAFFGGIQGAGQAQLILIRGEGMDGLSYKLNATEHVAGRKTGAILFPEDSFMSPRHANFFYEDEKLFVEDEGTLNGIFLRIRKPHRLEDGDLLLAGEEILKIELGNPKGPLSDAEQTQVFASPRPSILGRVLQIFEGGRTGLAYPARTQSLCIGRENCELSFPSDRFISGRHCQLNFEGGGVILQDLNSRNGTYVRLKKRQELLHEDYLFLGKQLLRVEISGMGGLQ